MALPHFPQEEEAKLVLFVREFDPKREEPHRWVPRRDATEDDVAFALRELGLPERELLARRICPELADRLQDAEGVIEGTLDARLGVRRAERYVTRYAPMSFEPGENPTRERTGDPVIEPDF